MALATFGVNHQSVRAHYFSQMAGEFSTTTKPTNATVDEMVADAAATLDAKLRAEGQDPEDIQEQGATVAAYTWCRHTLRLATAIRVAEATGSTQYAGAIERWQKELDARWASLDEDGAVALGEGASTSTTSPNGPLHHINNHSLDTGDEADISDVVPKFRRSDLL